MKKKLILGILLFAVIVGAGIGISKLINPSGPVTQNPKTVTVYGAVGGGKVFDGVKDLTNAFREVRGYN